MEGTATTPEQITASAVRPLIESFVANVMPEKWTLLRSGELDEDTHFVLALLLLKCISYISKDLVESLQSSQLQSDEYVLGSDLRNSISQTFSEVMNIKCVISEELTTLIVKEVTETISSALSSREGSEEPVIARKPPNTRLNIMVYYASKMFQAYANTPLPCPKRDVNIVLELEVESDEFQQDSEPPTQSVEPGISLTALSQAFQAAINKQVNVIKQSVLFSLTDSEQTLLQAESSLDIQFAAADVARLIVQSLKGRDSAAPTPKTKRRSRVCKDRVLLKLKTFLLKYLLKSSMLYALIQLKARLIEPSTAESKDSMCSFMDSVEFLVLRDIDENNKGANEESVFSKLEEMFSGERETLSKELTDLLYTDLKIRSMQSSSEVLLDDTLYAAIGAKVECCLDLTKWWLNTRAAPQSEDVIHAVMANHPLEETLLLLHSTSETNDSETQLRTLIIMLVQRTYKKAQVPHRMGKPEDIVDHLLEKTRAQLENIDLDMSEKTFKQLSKVIFKHLHKKTGCPSRLLLLMELRDPQIEESLVSFLKQHVTQPPEQQSTWSRFFSNFALPG
ncbi:hypothetical protein Q8A73_000213 [Channa argus]|nr:hypothetical protein Q8A73_000213 [Channa argus]